MSRRSPTSTKMQSGFTSMAEDFDEPPLHNKVHDDIAEDEGLARFCDAAAAAEAAGEYRGQDDRLTEAADESWGRLRWAARQRALGVVAEACATVITDGDQWVKEGHWEQQAIDDAKHEAREWLQVHTNEAERTGVLEAL
ncbi:hypothetical protein [Haloarcula onubensis]|uniref:Uncharacterized protein n=1 Tax=Haloarcula onubensis TaxID=2950539 RepID=A0ABU2FVA0_9EURY|nr:hypothetical protein [Halomicroarcula sp. S3CR25-11]MDS0284700.1 hypothetical protein [Halomicroarcula sp. S3CR25-11]